MKRAKRFYGHMNPVIAWMIRELYFSRRMNQTQLADLFQISQGSVSRIVSGQSWDNYEQTQYASDPRGARPWDQVLSRRGDPVTQQ